jgi:single-strand DNA-binding protein
MNLNKAFVLGNVTRDPEVRSMPNGGQVTNFSIATNRVWKDAQGQKKEEAEFHNIVCFGKLADITARYLTKGSLVLIEGRIKTRNWTDTAGVKHYKTEIIAETMQLGPRNAGGGAPSGNSNYSRPSAKMPEPEPAKQDDIPVIEENYTPPSNEPASAEEQKPVSFEDNAADEIDVKDIPF